MRVEVRRSLFLPVPTVPILIITLLLHAHICRAAVSAEGAGISSASGGGGEWLVGDITAAAEEEFLMDSEINRRMLGTVRVTDGTKIAKKQSVACGRGKDYKNCLPRGNKGGKPKPNCGRYNRAC